MRVSKLEGGWQQSRFSLRLYYEGTGEYLEFVWPSVTPNLQLPEERRMTF